MFPVCRVAIPCTVEAHVTCHYHPSEIVSLDYTHSHPDGKYDVYRLIVLDADGCRKAYEIRHNNQYVWFVPTSSIPTILTLK